MTPHALQRLRERRIHRLTVAAAVLCGDRVRVLGDDGVIEVHCILTPVLARRLRTAAAMVVDSLVVVVAEDGRVVTAFRSAR